MEHTTGIAGIAAEASASAVSVAPIVPVAPAVPVAMEGGCQSKADATDAPAAVEISEAAWVDTPAGSTQTKFCRLSGDYTDSEEPTLHERIVRIVSQLYRQLPSHGKPKNNEYTVLAAIVLERKVSSELEVVSMATGTKCLGFAAEESDAFGCLLVDSHAEVIARRGFQRYLLKCANAAKTECGYNLPIELIGAHPLHFRIKESVAVHMFISDSPCGDASIYSSSQKDGAAVNFTGAKLVPAEAQTGEWEREDNQRLGCMRTKSGRSDTCSQNRTAAKSCSDKICKWIYTGIQG
jgi:hypothetical protein